jgi:hypothetical protein
VAEADSRYTVSFFESRAASGAAKFCFAVAADRACDPAASACCAAGLSPKKLGLREFRLAVGACMLFGGVFVLINALQGMMRLLCLREGYFLNATTSPNLLNYRPALRRYAGARAPAPV